MNYTLRPYQQAAVDAALAYARKRTDKQVIVAATGAGKSLIISALAKELTALSGKRVLVLAPNAKLVIQNHEKYESYGLKASIFCASAGVKCLAHDVVFGSPLSVANALDAMADFSAMLLDECDLITASIRQIIDTLVTNYPRLRVIGLTATPYRMGTGYIYGKHYQQGVISESKNPYFDMCTYDISARELLANDPPFLSRPDIVLTGAAYDTSGLELTKTGQWDPKTVDAAFLGHGRLTSSMIVDIIEKTRHCRGVLIFGSTIAHCHEIMASLPAELSCLATGEDRAQRIRAEDDFGAQRKKYLVNVSTQSVGCDYPHADAVVMMRRTESARLFQQIIGRILRLYPGHAKRPIILDYAGNIEEHFPGGDVFSPIIKVSKGSGSEKVSAICPECGHDNQFSPPLNPEPYAVDDAGYYVDNGERVKNKYDKWIAAHSGRRCKGIVGIDSQCQYLWPYRECPSCAEKNDITARRCKYCKEELLDPNDKLMFFNAETGKFDGKKELVKRFDIDDFYLQKLGKSCNRASIVTESGKKLSSLLYPDGGKKSAEKFKEFDMHKKIIDDKKPVYVLWRQPESSNFAEIVEFMKT